MPPLAPKASTRVMWPWKGRSSLRLWRVCISSKTGWPSRVLSSIWASSLRAVMSRRHSPFRFSMPVKLSANISLGFVPHPQPTATPTYRVSTSYRVDFLALCEVMIFLAIKGNTPTNSSMKSKPASPIINFGT